MSAPIVLPADVYDALELSALVYGGIGRGAFKEHSGYSGEGPAPCCIIGHARWIADEPWRMDEPEEALVVRGIDIHSNDRIVRPGEGRLSWSEYCRRANIIRGDDRAGGATDRE